MYFFQSIFLLLVLCIFSFFNYTFCESKSLPNIREKGSSSMNLTDVKANYSLENTSSVLHQNVSAVSGLMKVASEGGGVLPSTAEAYNEGKNALEQKTITGINGTNKLNSTHSQNIKPVHESVISTLDIAPKQDDEKPSVPKKGVSFNDLDSHPFNVTDILRLNISSPTNTSSNIVYRKVTHIVSNHNVSTNATVIHKKPLVTESDTDYINMSKSNVESSKETISIDQIDPLLIDKKSKRSDYIVPIVAVILSVPLVAILTSILYKRGTDWWQHRNYKRMDFLIEGMYHN